MKKNKWLKLVSITAALVLAVTAAGCGSEQSSDNTAASDVHSVANLGEVSEPQNPIYHVGDTLSVFCFDICCTEFEDEDFTDLLLSYGGDADLEKIGEGMKIVRAYITAKNHTEQKETLSSVSFQGVADDEEVIEVMTCKDPKEEMKIRSKNDMFVWDAPIKPGETYGGYVYYYVPEDYTHFGIRFFDYDMTIECK